MKTALIEELSLKLANIVAKEREIAAQLDTLKSQKARILRQIAEASGQDSNGNGSPTDKQRVLDVLRAKSHDVLRPFEISRETGIKANAVSVYLSELLAAN